MADLLPLSYDLAMALPERLAFRTWRRRQWAMVQGPSVLEIGAGTGLNLSFYPPDSAVSAIDRSARMLARARTRAERLKMRANLAVMDAQSLAFSRHIFDTVLATFVFCSVPDPVAGLREARRVLRPGGRLVLLEHVRPSNGLGALADAVDPLTERLAGEHFNRETVENVHKAGFTVEECQGVWDGVVLLIVAHA